MLVNMVINKIIKYILTGWQANCTDAIDKNQWMVELQERYIRVQADVVVRWRTVDFYNSSILFAAFVFVDPVIAKFHKQLVQERKK